MQLNLTHLQKEYPEWVIRENDEHIYAFKNVRCVEGFSIAIRIGFDRAVVFGKNGNKPNFFHMNPHEFANMEDFKGNIEGIRPFELGCVGLDKKVWLSDCFYTPGLGIEDFQEIHLLLSKFTQLTEEPVCQKT